LISLPSPLPSVWTPSRGRSVAALLGALFAQAAVLGLAAWLTRKLFLTLGEAGAAGAAGFAGAAAVWPAAALGGCAAVLYALRVLERQTAEFVAQDYVQQVRRLLLGRVASHAHAELQRRLLRQVTSRLSGDMSALQQWIAQGAPRLMAAGLVLPVFAGVLWWVDPVLAVAALGPVLAAIALLAAAGPRLGATYRAARRSRARLAMDTLERLRMAAALRSAGGLRGEMRALRRRAEALGPQSRRKGRWTALVRHLPELGTGIGAACVLGVAVVLARPTADAAVSLAALGLLAHTLNQLAGVWDRWHAWQASWRFLARQLRRRPPEAPTADSAAPADRPGSAASGLAARVLALPPGARVCLSGPPGSGKSHLLRTLAGLEGPVADPSPLADALAGSTARETTPTVLLISALGPWLRGSLAKNLTFGVVDRRTRAEAAESVIEPLGLAGLRDRLAARDERVHEHGANLSTRERFLVLLARAWLRPPDLLLIDLGDWPIEEDLRRQVLRLLDLAPHTTLVSAAPEPVDWGPDTLQWRSAPSTAPVKADAEPLQAEAA
jgi:ABC-type multidrug transport system fused ATPase/permease subunit